LLLPPRSTLFPYTTLFRSEQADALYNQRPGLLVCRNRSEHDVGMATDIFGGRLHADVDALLKRAVIERRGPGVVVDDERAMGMRSEEHTSELQSLAYLVCR